MPATPPSSFPPDCFRQEEVEWFQSFENQKLETVHYFLWRVHSGESFLHALELAFENGETLLLSADEDSDAIRVVSENSLAETARKLQKIHGEAVVQKMLAHAQPLWQDVPGKVLQGIRLSSHENGLYQNDALLLDFGGKRILLQLSLKNGLELGEYDFE